ncbi:Oxidoreductase molybdopterin binding domain-containing protein [Peptoclostridium litorale DSM 5388]|uniref:Oxidoreductase molybdopterin binding n=1 Tax=Peptoclostridium litorale DSM 5388 TaxID=1121324 RepID=A0A069RMN9_PEPLI|nr:molybdopterin-dependent oxidoreductase [Peptoclostridium litorale]KDR95452.1 oxidoreductase molybdopterin binding [Peptoclostridium litorale DSM 5388]SIO18427.1 Oxidoreductase molybdopterin binding domain-containing protein [Peptoclostridium litorale DSM 5388]
MKRVFCLTTLLLSVLLLVSCNSGSRENASEDVDVISKATENRFSELEIRDYKGTKLDPSAGLRDNSIKGIQTVDINSYILKVSGLVKSTVSLSYDDVLSLAAYEKLITLHCVEGWDATVLWKGAMLKDIIDLAGADEKADTVIFHCIDGYTTSIPLQDIIDKKMILAYSSNRITLPPSLGYPFIVVAEDKLGYKWARWVIEIELSDNSKYKGYWESRGYDNEADVPDSEKK